MKNESQFLLDDFIVLKVEICIRSRKISTKEQNEERIFECRSLLEMLCKMDDKIKDLNNKVKILTDEK